MTSASSALITQDHFLSSSSPSPIQPARTHTISPAESPLYHETSYDYSHSASLAPLYPDVSTSPYTHLLSPFKATNPSPRAGRTPLHAQPLAGMSFTSSSPWPSPVHPPRSRRSASISLVNKTPHSSPQASRATPFFSPLTPLRPVSTKRRNVEDEKYVPLGRQKRRKNSKEQDELPTLPQPPAPKRKVPPRTATLRPSFAAQVTSVSPSSPQHDHFSWKHYRYNLRRKNTSLQELTNLPESAHNTNTVASHIREPSKRTSRSKCASDEEDESDHKQALSCSPSPQPLEEDPPAKEELDKQPSLPSHTAPSTAVAETETKSDPITPGSPAFSNRTFPHDLEIIEGYDSFYRRYPVCSYMTRDDWYVS